MIGVGTLRRMVGKIGWRNRSARSQAHVLVFGLETPASSAWIESKPIDNRVSVESGESELLCVPTNSAVPSLRVMVGQGTRLGLLDDLRETDDKGERALGIND